MLKMGASVAEARQTQSADEVWLDLLSDIVDHGAESRPRGLRIKELLCRTTRIDMRRPAVAIKARKVGYRFMIAEAFWILSGRNDVASIARYSPHIASFSDDGRYFQGAYGPRIVEQLTYVCDCLCKDPDSRQAVVGIWRQNPRDSKDVSCTLSAQFLLRDGQLNCVDTMRSSDAWLGWIYDVVNFSALSAYVALMLRYRTGKAIELGDLFLTAGSSHLYVDPKADGADNIPYGLRDVDFVLAASRREAHVCGEDDRFFKVDPLELNEFSSPDDFLRHLELLKDRVDSRHRWMRELLIEEKS
jgi:thymidylate synthase